MKIGRLYILIGKYRGGVMTMPAEAVTFISLPFLPIMLWVHA